MGNQCYCHPIDLFLKKKDKNVKLFNLDGKKFRAKVIDIYDGDTCTVIVFFHMKNLQLFITIYKYFLANLWRCGDSNPSPVYF